MPDLSVFDTKTLADSGVVMPIYDPKGNLVDGMTITVAGSDSDRVRSVYEARWDDRVKAGGKLIPTSAENQNSRLDHAVAATVAWQGFDLDGKPLECTPQNARMVYKKFPALMRRVIQFSEDEANFTKAAQSG